ncbi:hypothetical protein BG452_24400 [Streptomyces sp. CBMA123]|nr:hypothetical protein [Streptomyces sp. CBMA123]
MRRNGPGSDDTRWDAVVVGAGFAGSLVAQRLGARGWRVLVLEAGRTAPTAGGTHLMGDAPGTSVVDQWQRCWDHPNLYAVGCGSMPSLGTSNPSLTMAALALRSAERIHQDLLALRRPAALSAPSPPSSPPSSSPSEPS